jgi:hypothetical protein
MKLYNTNCRRELGQGTIENIILVSLIVIASITAFTLYGNLVRMQRTAAGAGTELSGQHTDNKANTQLANTYSDTKHLGSSE